MSTERDPCAVCGLAATTAIWGTPLCNRDLTAWAADLPGRVGFVREQLSHEEYVARSKAQVREWLDRRTGRGS